MEPCPWLVCLSLASLCLQKALLWGFTERIACVQTEDRTQSSRHKGNPGILVSKEALWSQNGSGDICIIINICVSPGCSFNKSLLSTYSVPSTALGAMENIREVLKDDIHPPGAYKLDAEIRCTYDSGSMWYIQSGPLWDQVVAKRPLRTRAEGSNRSSRREESTLG